MTVKEFLQSKTVNVSHVAKKMWPKNKNAEIYLYKKLSGERPFTKKDAENALDKLKTLSESISGLTLE